MRLIADVWGSAMRLPGWVLIWVLFVLVPVNLASVAFLSEPYGVLVAALAVGGMVPNVFIILRERGVSRLMAFPHLVIWTPLVFLLLVLLQADPAPEYARYLWLLLAVDVISLGFDYRDGWRWWRGERRVA